MWEAGSVSFNRTDEYSDIDLMIIAEDDRISDTFTVIEDALKGVSEIELIYEVSEVRAEGFYQKFYRLKGAGRFMLIDLAIFPLSAEDKFLEREIHSEPLVYFDKGDYTKCDPINLEEYTTKIDKIKSENKTRFDIFEMIFEKNMNRGLYIEALDFYYFIAIPSLILALRLIHSPFHYAFRSKYIHYDLPLDDVKRLESLFFVKDREDLNAKYKVLKEWFYEVANA